MKPFFKAKSVSEARMLKLVKWTKKYAKYGAYAEVEEYSANNKKSKYKDSSMYDVLLYCPTIHTRRVISYVTEVVV